MLGPSPFAPADPATPTPSAPSPWFECVVNVSEGRDSTLIAQLGEIATRSGVWVADITSDHDHHRTVLTWFGTGDEIWASCGEMLSHLANNRCLGTHAGVHPRTGLLDVIPVVPLNSFATHVKQQSSPGGAVQTALLRSTIAAAAQCARHGARHLAREFSIPAYLYEYAATLHQRTNLADHRSALQGGSNPCWPSDYGPTHHHPHLGAILVGARQPLVAFNLDLNTKEARLAKHIAHRIRATTPGGLPGVKALGLELRHRGCSQVSVNLVDPAATSLPTLVHRVAAEARALGCLVEGTELIGLTTRAAVDGASADDLRLPQLTASMFVETHLYDLLSARCKQLQ